MPSRRVGVDPSNLSRLSKDLRSTPCVSKMFCAKDRSHANVVKVVGIPVGAPRYLFCCSERAGDVEVQPPTSNFLVPGAPPKRTRTHPDDASSWRLSRAQSLSKNGNALPWVIPGAARAGPPRLGGKRVFRGPHPRDPLSRTVTLSRSGRSVLFSRDLFSVSLRATRHGSALLRDRKIA